MMNQQSLLAILASVSLVLVVGAKALGGGNDDSVGTPISVGACNVAFKDCGSVKGKLLKASYNESCSGNILLLKKGTVAGIDFHFQANEEETVLMSKVEGKLSVLPAVPFPLDNPNACVNSGLKCPVAANKPVDFHTAVKVLTSYPAINLIIKWQLQDKNKQDVFCVEMPAKIVS